MMEENKTWEATAGKFIVEAGILRAAPPYWRSKLHKRHPEPSDIFHPQPVHVAPVTSHASHGFITPPQLGQGGHHPPSGITVGAFAKLSWYLLSSSEDSEQGSCWQPTLERCLASGK